MMSRSMPLRRPPPNTFIPPSYEESLDSPPSYVHVERLTESSHRHQVVTQPAPEYSEFNSDTSVEQTSSDQQQAQPQESVSSSSELSADITEPTVDAEAIFELYQFEDSSLFSTEEPSSESPQLHQSDSISEIVAEEQELPQPDEPEQENLAEPHQSPRQEFIETETLGSPAHLEPPTITYQEQTEDALPQPDPPSTPETDSEEVDLQPPSQPAPPPPEPLLISLDDEPAETVPHRPLNLTNIADLVFLPDPVPEPQQEIPSVPAQPTNSTSMPITSNDNEINLLDLDSEPVIVAPPAVLNYNLPPTLPHPHEHLTKLQANLRAQLQLEQMQRDMLSFSFASPESRHGSIGGGSVHLDPASTRNILPPTPPPFNNTRFSTATSVSASSQDTNRSFSMSSSTGFRTSQNSHTAPSIYSFSGDSNLNLNLTMPSSSTLGNLERVLSIDEQRSTTTLEQVQIPTEWNINSMIIDSAPSVRTLDTTRTSSAATSQYDRPRVRSNSQFERSHIGTSSHGDRLHSVATSQFDSSTSGSIPGIERAPTSSTNHSLDRVISTTSSDSSRTRRSSNTQSFKTKFKRKPKKQVVEPTPKASEIVFGLNFLKSKYDLGDSITGKIAYRPSVDKPVRSITFVLLLTEKTIKQSRTVVLDTHVLRSYETPILNSFAEYGQVYECDYSLKVPLLIPKSHSQSGDNSDLVLPLQERLPPSTVTSELSIEYSVRILIEHQHPSPPIVRLANYESETMTSETVGIKISPSYAPSEFDSRMATRESVFTHIYKGSGTISAKGFLKTTQTFGIAELHVLGLQKFSLLSTEETTVKLSVLFFPEPNIKRVTLPYITRIVASLEIRTFISPTKRMENYPDADGAQTETIPIFDEPVGDSGWTKLPTPPQLSRDVLLYGAAHTVPLKELVAHRNELVPSFLSCYGCREYELVVSVSFNPTKVITVRVPLAVVVQNEPKTFLPFAAYD